MPQLRASEHYVWSETDVLGRGATGEVYKARNKSTGEVFAVKTSNHMGIMRPVTIQKRELDVLCKLDHKNIVQLLAIEEDVSTRGKVIVMELCTGGSLYNILDEPHHAYGLPEAEFLTVMFDVAGGMEYLRSRDIVHRDIKPGNIMKCITEDGRSVYKLTDFGAARELENEEQFMSLYGTEEYLHPDMYERAVMNIHTGKTFKATVDLWSLGVTFYHVATGQLPFRPLGGRRNREMMYMITQKKDSGIISGVQETEGGVVRWSRVLPDTCALSIGLKSLITPMFASLLESDATKLWGFDQFFHEVRRIREKTIITVFHSCAVRILKLYVDPQANLSQLQEEIAEQTDLAACQQILLFENTYLSDIVEPLQTVNTYPQTSNENPLFLFPKETAECSVIEQPQVDKLPVIENGVSTETDAGVSRQCCGILHSISSHMNEAWLGQTLLRKGCKLLLQVFGADVQHIQECAHHIDTVATEIGKRVKCLQCNQTMCLDWCKRLAEHQTKTCSQQSDLIDALKHQHTEIALEIREIKQDVESFSEEKENVSKLSFFSTESTEEESTRKGQIGILLNSVSEITELFRKNRLHRRLLHNEEQIHKFEKMRLQSVCAKAWSVYEHSHQQTQGLTDRLKQWLGSVQQLMKRHRQLEDRVAYTLSQLQLFSSNLDQRTEEWLSRQQEIISQAEAASLVRRPPVIRDDVDDGAFRASAGTSPDQSSRRSSQGSPSKSPSPSSSRSPRQSVSRSVSQKDRKKQMLQSLQTDLSVLTSDTVEIRKAMQENQQVLNMIKLMNEQEADSRDHGFEIIHSPSTSEN